MAGHARIAVGTGEVGVGSGPLDMGGLTDGLEKRGGIGGEHPEAAHAGIDFDLHQSPCAGAAGGPLDRAEIIETGKGEGEPVSEDGGQFAGEKAAEEENGESNACPAQREAFVHMGTAEFGAAVLLQEAGHGDLAVSVGIGLDQPHEPDVGAGQPSKGVEVMTKGAQIDFAPTSERGCGGHGQTIIVPWTGLADKQN